MSRRRAMIGCAGFSSSVRLAAGASWPARRSSSRRCGEMSPGSPTRQAGDSVSRDDSRTSFTWSWSCARRVSSRPRSPSSCSLRASSSLLASSSVPPPWRPPRPPTRASCPRTRGSARSHSSSTGSVKNRTSKPLARKASRCGERSAALSGGGRHVVDGVLPFLHARDVVGQRGELGRRGGRRRQHQLENAVLAAPRSRAALP